MFIVEQNLVGIDAIFQLLRCLRLRPHSTTPIPTRAIPHEDPREDVGVGVVECGL